MVDKLTTLWTDFCSELNVEVDIKEKWLQLIKSQYERPYYDINYLINKLRSYEFCREKLKEPNAILVALIFQSIYYSTNSTENLEKCMETFTEFASEVGLIEKNADLRKSIHQLIELSVTNSSDEFWEEGTFGTEDSHYFLDINFVHLAHHWEDYKEFSIKTRNEYNFLSDENYKILRRKVLQSFLHIPNIYATSQFRIQFEEKARMNIQREIDELD